MTVATNLYLDYWKDLVRSADLVSSRTDLVKFFVFTDNPESAMEILANLRNVEVCVIQIPPYKWPEATLLRYKIFLENFDKVDTSILVHLDADMLINDNPWRRIVEKLIRDNICLVRHPGFWRSHSLRRVMIYLKNPNLAIQDAKQKIVIGGLGSWEERIDSEAFVPRGLRKKYYCGGVWFGKKESIHGLLKDLSNATDRDLEKRIIASWHDESHLNHWASKNVHGEETPELCFDETYPQLQGLLPCITAVRKTLKTR